ncbi:MAG: hypothetical protein MJE12_15625 [Alphaproteobacteria bacterium]|nr:hypothetical protein [Alphaproteobacteria bacterium]
MATDEDTATPGDTQEGKAKKRPGSALTWLIGAAILVAFYESIILLIVGMAPTVVAILIDRSPQKTCARTVGYLNFAGCVPWAVQYWIGGGDLDRVFDMVGDPYVLLVMYASAGVGWLLFFAMRPVAASYLAVAGDIKASQLKKRQQDLIEGWGPEVREQAEASGLIPAVEAEDAAADDAEPGTGQTPAA